MNLLLLCTENWPLRLPPAHRDPFDRVLVVQAKPTGSTLVSPDKAFSKYPVEVFL